MNAYERLREYAEATRRGGECGVLHRFHRDAGDVCGGRGCDECRAAYLHAIADGADAEMRDMNARLMPEGMSWPRYTDGSLVEIGDEVVGSDYGERINVDAVKFHANGFTLCDKGGFEERHECDDLFERPAKVLDADGVEIRRGDTVWTTYGLGPFEVTRSVYADQLRVIADDEENGHLNAAPKNLTHRPPVLAADGEPLHEGETVWDDAGDQIEIRALSAEGNGLPGHVVAYDAEHGETRVIHPSWLTHQPPVLDADGVPIKKGETVYVAPFDDPLTVRGFAADGRVLMDCHSDDSLGYGPERLTHARPDLDTWERIEEDAKLWPGEYAQGHPGWAEHDGRLSEFMALDLVRRCRVLAERERGE